jgi:prolyl-tRNA synthetase
MRLSQLFTRTLREAPKDELSRGTQMLLRAGFIHKEMAGVYTFLPLGLKVLNKIQNIVREEMNAIGGQELQMTSLQNKQLWEQTGRWSDQKVDIWFKTKLQNGNEIGLAWSHEEPMTSVVGSYANSYKDLPIYTYQFQWKLRNELRAKSGIMRCREFLMKDLYSFSTDQKQHDEFYAKIGETYTRVYQRLGLGHDTYYTYASGGAFSKFSHEYQTELEVGEDTIYVDDEKKIAINEEVLGEELIKELGLDRGKLRKTKAAEVGNIFPLGTTYSKDLGANFTDAEGTQHDMIMGSYGIGVSRLMGVIAEYFADDKGLIWPESVAPGQVYLIRIGNEESVLKEADKLYDQLIKNGYDVLYDDRDVSAGAKFADADLIGCPVRLTISPKTFAENSAEIKHRKHDDVKLISLSEAADPIKG